MHQIRSSLRYVNYRDKRRLAADLRPVYTAANADHALEELERFEQTWGARYPMIAQAWRRDWEYITPFLALPGDLRRVVYTTDENVKDSMARVELVFGGGIGRAGCAQGRRSASVALLRARSGGSGRFRACGGSAGSRGGLGATVSGR